MVIKLADLIYEQGRARGGVDVCVLAVFCTGRSLL